MKTKLSVLLGLFIFFAACKKNNNHPTKNPTIEGTWELRATRKGNIIPATYAPGNGNLLSFSDAGFAQYAAGSMVDKGTYVKSTSASYQYMLILDIGYAGFTSMSVAFKGDTLQLLPGNPDIATGFYIKTGSAPLSN